MNKQKLKKNLPNILLAVAFLIGLGIFLYPSISDLINSFMQAMEISEYESIVSQLSTEEYEKMLSDAREYNETLVGHNLSQNIESVEDSNYYDLLSLDSRGIMGYLYIPKISVRLPIYHGTDDSVLQKGIGHLAGSSLPVDGESQHVVLSGHTGLPSSTLLTDLVELEVGDIFKIDILNQRYTYEVDQILVVEPNETDSLEIEEGKQYATLVTCTPYGVNTHRLLVRGHLIDDTVDSNISGDAVIIDSQALIPIIAIPLIIILFIVMINIRRIKGRRNEADEEKDNIK